MRVLTMRRGRVLSAVVFSIVIVMLNLLTLRYLVSEDIENADLAVLAGKSIAIDPGHGGIDDGASWNGIDEKKINLAIALKCLRFYRQTGQRQYLPGIAILTTTLGVKAVSAAIF